MSRFAAIVIFGFVYSLLMLVAAPRGWGTVVSLGFFGIMTSLGVIADAIEKKR